VLLRVLDDGVLEYAARIAAEDQHGIRLPLDLIDLAGEDLAPVGGCGHHARRHRGRQDPDPPARIDQRAEDVVAVVVERRILGEGTEREPRPLDLAAELDARLNDGLVDVERPLGRDDPVDALEVGEVTLDAVRIGHQDAHVDRVVRRGQDGQVGGGELSHPTILRTSSIVQSAPRNTTASLHAAGASLPPDGTPESRMTCPLHAAGSPIADERAATTGVPPLMLCSIWTLPSAYRRHSSSTRSPMAGTDEAGSVLLVPAA